MRLTTNHPEQDLTHDDMDMLQAVLMKVQGSYPDAPYIQSDYMVDELDPDA